MEGESCLTRSIIDELHSWNMQFDKVEGELVRLEVSLMNLILRISNEIKWKVKVVFLEGSWMKFIFQISKDIK